MNVTQTSISKDGVVLQHQRNYRLLATIHRMRWVTAEHIAILEFSQQKSALNSARKWIKKALDDKLIIERNIPTLGRAFVLSQGAVDYMDQHRQISVRSGKDWGKFVEGVWQPPATYNHEYLTNIYMAWMIWNGFETVTEYEIRAANPNVPKIPDLLVNWGDDEFSSWVAVETEYYRKSSKHMRALATAIHQVAMGRFQLALPDGQVIPVRHTEVLFRSGVLDERGYQIDYLGRISSAMARFYESRHEKRYFNITYTELLRPYPTEDQLVFDAGNLFFNHELKWLEAFDEERGHDLYISYPMNHAGPPSEDSHAILILHADYHQWRMMKGVQKEGRLIETVMEEGVGKGLDETRRAVIERFKRNFPSSFENGDRVGENHWVHRVGT